ncbi:MAG: hypothetical protein QM775_04090 [Pirellulales bacterium]
MASQVITITKVAGEAGRLIARRMETWSAQRETIDPREFDFQQWPEATRAACDQLIDALRSHRTAPPILYHTEYVDLWSAFDLFHFALDLEVEPLRVFGNRYEVECLVVTSASAYLPGIDSAIGRLRETHRQETCWALRTFRDCLTAWDSLTPESTIIASREVFGGSVMDDEVVDSLKQIPPWFSEFSLGLFG